MIRFLRFVCLLCGLSCLAWWVRYGSCSVWFASVWFFHLALYRTTWGTSSADDDDDGQ